MATETKTFYPGAHDTSDYAFQSISGATNPVGKGSSNTTKASILWKTGSMAVTYIFWPFDLSSIPVGAVIDSVVCTVRAAVSSTSYATYMQAQLYSGNTPKGTASNLGNDNTTGAFSLAAGTWSRDELATCRLRLYVKRNIGSPTSSHYLYFYGADLTVTYTYQSEKFMLKLGGAWHDIARVFKKVSGIWVEQTDLANVIEDGVRYQNGGEIESAGPALITFTIDGTTYQAEEGMTWADYVASSYNTAGFSISGGYVLGPSGRQIGYTSAALATDKIIDGQTYYY